MRIYKEKEIEGFAVKEVVQTRRGTWEELRSENKWDLSLWVSFQKC